LCDGDSISRPDRFSKPVRSALVYKRGYIDKMAAVSVGWGFWINCSVALLNFPE